MEQGFHAVPTLTLVTQVKEQIQRAITNGELLPNQRLVEGEIAQKLGVSRGPVREAARLLEQSGLLISLPRRGFFVRQFEAREIEDLYELREWIEAAAVESAVKRATPQQHQSLRATHKNLIARAQSGQQSELIEAIIEFHRSICELSGNANEISKRAIKLEADKHLIERGQRVPGCSSSLVSLRTLRREKSPRPNSSANAGT